MIRSIRKNGLLGALIATVSDEQGSAAEFRWSVMTDSRSDLATELNRKVLNAYKSFSGAL